MSLAIRFASNRLPGSLADDCARRITCYHPILTGLDRLHTGKGERGLGCPGQWKTIELPLKSGGGIARGAHGECNRAPLNDSLTQGLHHNDR